MLSGDKAFLIKEKNISILIVGYRMNGSLQRQICTRSYLSNKR